ncbi:nitroreductase/quinone reductase family protein [Gordonia zhenghanii]|uniref:nitroreductase/quinone reductase family protein n=1 Tax=Gordonia zhenghanii TaxID=2911516 RepID=UPI0027DF916B|nr:nitroreductase/quinone reductase family protein [Gordonia zhenghanii]
MPVAASFDQTGAWIISQHGLKAGWARNISADPRVRIRQGQRWRSGIAEFRPEDDVSTRAAGFATSRLAAPLIVSGFRALQTDPISVRITFTE